MATESEAGQDDARRSIEYRDTASIIGPALIKLEPINKSSSDFLVEAVVRGFFDSHQSKGALNKMAGSLLKTVKGEDW